MKRKRFTPTQTVKMLRQAETLLASGKRVPQVCRQLGIAEQTYYRWKNQYGGMKTSEAKRLKELDKENTRLKKLVADLTLDKQILKEAIEGKY